MHRFHFQPRPARLPRTFITACLAIALATWLIPLHAYAHTYTHSARLDAPTFRVNIGFDARSRDGNWVPVQVDLRNTGADFNGKISVNVPQQYSNGQSNPSTSSIYQETINLPTGAQKQVTLYVPFNIGIPGTSQNISVDLLDTNDQVVSTQSAPLHTLNSSDIFIGILSDQSNNFGPLSAVSLPNRFATVVTEPLTTATMPTKAEALNNFDALILDNFTTSSLSKDQITALQRWVHQGGTLLTVGGPEWRRTLSSLPADLLPVTPTGTQTLPPNTSLLPVGGPGKDSSPANKGDTIADTLQMPVIASSATLSTGSSAVLSAGNTPLIVQAQQGEGMVYYLAIDPTLSPVLTWSSASTLWKGLLFRALGDKVIPSSLGSGYPGMAQTVSLYNGNSDSMGILLQSFFPNAVPSIWLILVLLLGYIVVLGPIRLLLVRRLKNRDWSWRIILSTIIIFSLLSYGLALQQKGTSIISSSISLVQLNRPDATGSTAHTSTYVGMFVPSQGDFQVHVPGDSLVQPLAQSSFVPGGPGQTTPQNAIVTTGQDSTDVKLQGVDIWTMRTVVSRYDQQLKGGITSHLVLDNNLLTGTVTNTLPYALNDVYILIGNNYQSLGRMEAGQDKTVQFAVDSTVSTSTPSLADQIASSHGLPSPYTPYNTYGASGQTTSEAQRHIATLTALSGEGPFGCNGLGPCSSQGIIAIKNANGTVFTKRAFGMGNSTNRDPLLLSGADATLIGWADHPSGSMSDITINGNQVTNSQDVVVQAPLDVTLSGAVNTPNNFITGQIIDAQSQNNSIETPMAGMYTLSTGSMTFEFTVPDASKLHISTVSFNAPNTAAQAGPPIPNNAGVSDINALQTSLYNWQTGQWDSVSFKQFTLTVNNAQPYVGPGGRLVMQIANQNANLGATIFSIPALQVQGSTAN